VKGYALTSTADADENTQILRKVIPDPEDEKANQHDRHDGPEIDQLCGQNSRISISNDGKIVAFNIHECEDEISPAVFVDETQPFSPAVAVEREAGVDEVK
jgi:hypothetical protein